MKEQTITSMLEQIANEICDHYCKYPAIYAERYGDCDNPDADIDKLQEQICIHCPLCRI